MLQARGIWAVSWIAGREVPSALSNPLTLDPTEMVGSMSWLETCAGRKGVLI